MAHLHSHIRLVVLLLAFAAATTGKAPQAAAADRLNLTTITGQDLVTGKDVKFSLKDSKTWAFVFLSSRCPCSASHVPHIQSLADQHKGIRFVAVLSNRDEDLNLAKQAYSTVKFPIIVDPKQEMADAFGANKTPHVFVTDAEGNYKFLGGVTNSSEFGSAKKFYLADALNAIEKGLKAPVHEAKALGCYITRE